VNEGVLFRSQLNLKELDRTNFYSINPLVLESEGLRGFFNTSITKKICEIYNINNKSVNKSSNKSKEAVSIEGRHYVRRGGSESVKGKRYITQAKVIGEEELNILFKPKSIGEKESHAGVKGRVNTAGEMLKIWNEVLRRRDVLSKIRACYLVSSFKNKFGESLEKWKEYVKSLKSSAYVTIDLWKRLGWKLLDWALSFKVMNRIFAGGFGCKYEDSKVDNEEVSREHIESLRGREPEECIEKRERILKERGGSEYVSWLRHVRFRSEEGRYLIEGGIFVTEQVKLRFLMNDDRYESNGDYEAALRDLLEVV
jgi:hypothetical protein